MKKEKASITHSVIQNIIGLFFSILIPLAFLVGSFGNSLKYGKPVLDFEFFIIIVVMISILLICAFNKCMIAFLKAILWLEIVLLGLSLIGIYF